VRSLTSTRYDDLRFLGPLLEGRRIVQLGESGHGVREFDQAKVRLIRYLHEQLGYDVIAFESSVFECWRANQGAVLAEARQTMRSCTYAVWWTNEVLELFEYIRQTHQTDRPLILAGIDMKPSTSLGNYEAPLLLREVVEKADAEYALRARSLDVQFLDEYRAIARSVPPFGPAWASLERLLPAYDSLLAWMDQHRSEIVGAYGGRAERFTVARQTVYSRIRQIRQLNLPSSSIEGNLQREVGMADNLDALLQGMYPGKKVIVWAHNYHIQHDRARLLPGDGSTPPDVGDFNTMGHFVMQRHRAELYTVGLFMYRGSAAWNDREIYTVAPAVAGSLESLGYRVRMQHFFLDLSGARGRGSEWVGQMIRMKEWGVWDMIQVPREQYDGILFVDTVSPPEYL
jgi:erythromycin esterase